MADQDQSNGNGSWISKAGFLPRLFTQALPRPKPFQEMGVSGTPVYAGYVVTAERNSRLIGQERHRTFADILTNTSIVSAAVRYFLNIIARPSWSVEPVDDSAQAKQYAELLQEILLEGTHTPWSRIIRRAGTYRFHGFQISEWTAERRDDGKIGFSDIESRPQWTIWRWEVDERGTVVGAWQRDPLTGRELGLPRTKILYLVDDTLTDSPEGMGLLRHCVEPADRLRDYLEQEAIGFLRDLRGVPIGRAPIDELNAAVKAGAITEQQKEAALAGLKDFITMEKKGRHTSIIVNSAPYVSKTDSGLMIANSKKWDVDLVQSRTSGLAEVGKAIDRLNYELARILSCENLLLGSTSTGSFALSKEKATDLYLMANSVLRDIRLQAQHDLVDPIWSLNGFPEEMKPKLKSEDVTPKDVEQIARVLRDMATAGAMIPPDDEAINFVRDLLGAPQLDLKQYFNQMMNGQAGPGLAANVTASAKAGTQEDKQDQIDNKQAVKAAPAMTSIRMIRKVLGDTAADYIHDFVSSGNKKFDGKSKVERIRMALGAYYSKMVPYSEAEEYRDEDAEVTGQPGTADGHENEDNDFDARLNVKPSGPSSRNVSTGQPDVLVPGSGNKSKSRNNGRNLAKAED